MYIKYDESYKIVNIYISCRKTLVKYIKRIFVSLNSVTANKLQSRLYRNKISIIVGKKIKNLRYKDLLNKQL